MNATLPQPSPSLNQCSRDLAQHGYCLFRDALADDQLNALRTRLTEQALAEKQKGLSFQDGGPTQNWRDFIDSSGALRAQ